MALSSHISIVPILDWPYKQISMQISNIFAVLVCVATDITEQRLYKGEQRKLTRCSAQEPR